MANELKAVMPKILAQGLQTLRETAVITQLVNTSYSAEAAQKGDEIDIPLPAKMEAQDVEPGPYSQATQDLQNDVTKVKLDNWKEAAFYLTDAEIAKVMDGYQSMQVQEAVKALVNSIARSIYRKAAINIYNAVGTAGTTPFASDASAAVAARKLLNKNMVPMTDRRLVLDVDAESNAVALENFQYADREETIIQGRVMRRYGFDIYMDQLLTDHPVGVHTGTPAINYVGGEPYTATRVDDEMTIYTASIDGFTGSPTVKAGDSFTVAGDTQTYVVTQDATVTTGAATVYFSPMPQVEWADNALVTFSAAYVPNLAFHRDCIALAIRPLVTSDYELELGGGAALTSIDPLTGIPIRLEVKREHKRVRWSFDALWGVGVPRPEFGVKILG